MGRQSALVKDVSEPGDMEQTRSIEVVRSGYERAAVRYAAARDLFKNEPHLERFIGLCSPPPAFSMLAVAPPSPWTATWLITVTA